MRVLLVTNMYPTPSEPWYGCFVETQVRDLRAAGVELELMAFDGRRNRLEYLWAARDVWKATRHGRFDLVHAHYGLCGAVAMAQPRIPVLTTFHGSETGYVRWQRYVSWVVARKTTSIFVSERSATQIGVAAAIVIPAPVDTGLFVPQERTAARRLLGWRNDAFYVVFPGARKNVVKRFDLFEATIAEVRKTIPQVETVVLEGLARADVACVFAAADATLMTSDSEGSPVTVRESLACKTPVVSVPVGDVESVLDGLPGCAVTAREPGALARAVVRALSAERDAALRRRAEQSSRREVVRRTIAVYEDVLRRTAGRTATRQRTLRTSA
jgi:glycosyltransferase involved in cell wall biosynthesis